ncbi:MAG: indolepyruvate ferredoxin oxidoreductase subunit alpha, partial [bacterium]|nr:indolepyruvate ferredoxin oxidoreductase subunit alpha [bacterium]
PGCGHTAVFHILKELKLAVNGDIGCYGLAALPPYDMTDSVICMGGGMTLNQGFAKVAALRENARPAVGVVGDSTFFHSGLTGVANMVYNKTPSTVLILDNRTTAMTGHQPNPTSGNKIGGEASPPLDIGEICRALGVKHVHEVDATDIDRLKEIVEQETQRDEPSVLVVRERCVMVERGRSGPVYQILDTCKECKLCLRLGCPAVSIDDGRIHIVDYLCEGCGLCANVCSFDAIVPKQESK